MYIYDQKVEEEIGKEYARRNLLHAASVGSSANASAALERLRKQKRPAKWLTEILEGIHERAERVAAEMASHRDEVVPEWPKKRAVKPNLFEDYRTRDTVGK